MLKFLDRVLSVIFDNRFLEPIFLATSYLLSLSVAGLGLLVLLSGGGVLGLNGIVAAILFLPNIDIPIFLRLLLTTIIVTFFL